MTIQNYSKSHPCPICGRYKTAYQNKCQGFLTDDGRFAYCSREISEGQKTISTPWGQLLYRHRLSGTEPLNTLTKDITPKTPSAIRQASTRSAEGHTDRSSYTQTGPSEQEVNLLDEVIKKFTDEGKWPYG